MPKVSRETASEKIALEGYEGRLEKFEGGYTAAFETYTADADLAELFRGLPDDRCQCPHWGYVLEGKVTYVYADSQETFETGDAYYAPPGHTPFLHAGTKLVEFSPTEPFAQTVAVVTDNLRASGIEV